MKKFFITLAALSVLCWYATAGQPNRERPKEPLVQEAPHTIVVVLPDGTVIMIHR